MSVHRLGLQSFSAVSGISFSGNGYHLANGNMQVTLNDGGYVDYSWAGTLKMRIVANGEYIQGAGGSPFTVRGNVAAGDSDPDFVVDSVVVRNSGDKLQGWHNNTTAKAWVRGDGRIVQGAPNSAIADADISASMCSFYLNEAGNTLTVKAKYADGATVKTGTVALV